MSTACHSAATILPVRSTAVRRPAPPRNCTCCKTALNFLSFHREGLTRMSFPKQRFTGRQEEIKVFESQLLHALRPAVLSFFGPGGFGKTYLLHHLVHRYGTEPDRPDGYPYAYISFRPGQTPPSPEDALWQVRADLQARSDSLTLPRFDLLCAKLRERIFQHTIATKMTLLSDEATWMAELLQSTEQIPFIGDFAKAVNVARRLRSKASQALVRRRISEWLVKHLEVPYQTGWGSALNHMPIAPLRTLLPVALASDLADWTAALPPPRNRAIILVDSYEYLQEQADERTSGTDRSFIQSFASELTKLRASVLLTICGRNKLRWAEIRRADGAWLLNRDAIWSVGVRRNDPSHFVATYLIQQPLDELNERDSISYLRDARAFQEERLLQEIYHLVGGFPLGLSTVADLLEQSKDSIDDSVKELRERTSTLPRMSEEWRTELCTWLLDRLFDQLRGQGQDSLVSLIRAAAVPRWFTESLLYRLMPQAGIQEQFDRLTKYSFVDPRPSSPPVAGEPVHRLHPTIRALILPTIRIAEQLQNWRLTTREYLVGLAAAATDPEQCFEFEIESLYHTMSLDRSKGILALEKRFEDALKDYRLGHCDQILQTLLEIERVSVEEADSIAVLAARLDLAAARYEAAVRRLSAARIKNALSDGFTPQRVAVAQALGEAYRLGGNCRSALGIWAEIRQAGENQQDVGVQFLAAWGASLTYKLLDNVPEALDACRAAERFLEDVTAAVPQRDAGAYGLHNLDTKPADLQRHKAELLRYGGDYVGAWELCDEFERRYPPSSSGFCYGLLVRAHIRRMEGNCIDAQQYAALAREKFESKADLRGLLSSNRALAQIALAACDTKEATSHILVLINADQRLYPYGPIYGHLGMGETLRLSGDRDGATREYELVRSLCTGLGGRVEAAYASLGLAEIARNTSHDRDIVKFAINAAAIGMASGYPWIEFYANLIAALGAAEQVHRDSYLSKAARAAKAFRRRPVDVNQEQKTLGLVQQAMSCPPLRLNYV